MSAFRVRPQEDPLAREQREIQGRRARDEQRKPRYLHAKTRLFGVDTMALDQQVLEKQEKERLDMERELYYDDLNSTFSRALSEQDVIRAQAKRQQQMELNEFRKAQEREKKAA